MDNRDLQRLAEAVGDAQRPHIQDPSQLPTYAGNTQYNLNPFMGGGRMPFGFGSILMQMFGTSMWPLMNPGGQQSLYDTVAQRQHDIQMMSMARKTVSSWYPFQNLGGMNENSMVTQIATSMLSNPDGIAAKFMEPILGGNPIQAQMSSFANLQGMAATGLGSVTGIGTEQLNRARGAFDSVFYNKTTRPINKATGDRYADALNKALSPETRALLGNPDTSNLLNKDRNNELNADTDAFRTLDRTSAAIDTILHNIGKGSTTTEEALKGVDEDSLGKLTYDKLVEAVKKGTAEGGKDNAKAVADSIKNNPAVKGVMDAHAAASGLGNAMLMQNIFRGMDFKNNLGLSYNTLTTARDELIKSRLFSPGSGIKNFEDLTGLVAGNRNADVPALVAAAKGLWGNDVPDKQLMMNMSDFIGKSGFNVSNPQDVAKAEEAMRSLKAVAREQNIDVNTLLSFHQQAQSFASQNKSTSTLGGLAISDLITGEAQKLMAVNSDNSASNNRFIRMQGGTSAQMAKNTETILELASQEGPAMVAGLHTYISDKYTGDERKAKLAEFNNFAAGKDGNFDLSMMGINAFVQHIAPENPTEAWLAIQNPVAQSEGYNNNSELLNVGKRAFSQQLNQIIRASGLGESGVTRLNAYKAAHDNIGIMKDSVFGAAGLGNILQYAVQKEIFMPEMLDMNPELKHQYEVVQSVQDISKKIDASTDRSRGLMRPGMMTRIMQSIAAGSFAKDGLVATMIKDFGGDPASQDYMKLVDVTKNLSLITGSKTVQDIAANSGLMSGPEATKFEGLIEDSKKYGIQTSNLTSISKLDDKDYAKVSEFISSKDAWKNMTEAERKVAGQRIITEARSVTGNEKLQKIDSDGKSYFGYNQDLSVGGLRDFAERKYKVDLAKDAIKARDRISGIDSVEVATQKLAFERGDKVSGEFLSKLMENAPAQIDPDTGKPITDGQKFDRVYDLIEKAGKGPDAVKGQAGQFELNKSLKSIVAEYPGGITAFTKKVAEVNKLSGEDLSTLTKDLSGGTGDEKTLQKSSSWILGTIKDDPYMKGLLNEDSIKRGQSTNELATIENGTEGASLESLVRRILDNLGGLDKIATAVTNVNDTLSTIGGK